MAKFLAGCWMIVGWIVRGRAALGECEYRATVFALHAQLDIVRRERDSLKALVDLQKSDLAVARRQNELLAAIIEENQARVEAVTADHANTIARIAGRSKE